MKEELETSRSVVDRIRVKNNEKNMICGIIPLPLMLKEK